MTQSAMNSQNSLTDAAKTSGLLEGQTNTVCNDINKVELFLPKGYINRRDQSFALAEFKEVIRIILGLT